MSTVEISDDNSESVPVEVAAAVPIPDTSHWDDSADSNDSLDINADYQQFCRELQALQMARQKAREQEVRNQEKVSQLMQVGLRMMGLAFQIEATWKLQGEPSGLEDQVPETRRSSPAMFYQHSNFYRILRYAWKKAGRRVEGLARDDSVGLTYFKMRRWLITVDENAQDQIPQHTHEIHPVIPKGASEEASLFSLDKKFCEHSGDNKELGFQIPSDAGTVKPVPRDFGKDLDWQMFEDEKCKVAALHPLNQVANILEQTWQKYGRKSEIGVWIDRDKAELHAVEFPLPHNIQKLEAPQPLEQDDKIYQTVMFTWESTSERGEDYGILNHWIVKDAELEPPGPVDETTLDNSSDEGVKTRWERELIISVDTSLRAIGTDYYSEASESECNAPGPSIAPIIIKEAPIGPEIPVQPDRFLLIELPDLNHETHVKKLKWVAHQFKTIWNRQEMAMNKVEV
ncbi:hypothetical protein C8J56DRAFT_1049028 [Mycena floridula]|nr:hypothetical protein C8J56DRAFT_1049028 [Mycena floridula]